MEWINYHHLLYFWTVARTGSIAKAAQELLLSPPTISAQIKRLEESLGTPLFRHESRGLVLTEMGHVAFDYAEGIFSLGRELGRVIREKTAHRPLHLAVGVDDAIPKVIVQEILRPVFTANEHVHVICREGAGASLLAELADYRLDVVITDDLPPSIPSARLYPHRLGQCPLTFLAEPTLAARLRCGFPASLDGAPALLPTSRSHLRRLLDDYFRSVAVEPRIVGEFDDSALAKVFGSEGLGFFVAPSAIAPRVAEDYGVEAVGTAQSCITRFYAVSVERRLSHPALLAITEAAQSSLFRNSSRRSRHRGTSDPQRR